MPSSRFGAGAISIDLLVAALHRAVPLEQVHASRRAASARICTSMWRGPQHGLLEEHGGVAERAVGLAHGRFERLAQVLRRVDPAHAAPAAAGDGLGEDREADLVGPGDAVRRCPSTAGSTSARARPRRSRAPCAVTLLPAISSTCSAGPMKVMPGRGGACGQFGVLARGSRSRGRSRRRRTPCATRMISATSR